MGGDLIARGDDVPVFLLTANKDPMGANLDRVQVIKGRVENGQNREKVYNAVLSDGRRAYLAGVYLSDLVLRSRMT